MREDNFNRIYEALSFIPAHDRDIWLKMGMAIKSELGEAGFDVWNNWSQQDNSYSARDARDVWKSISFDGGITIGTLFYEAKANGWKEKEVYLKPTLEEIAERKRIANERAVTEEAKNNHTQMKTEIMANTIWQKAIEAKADNPYLLRKKTAPVSTMREIDASELAAILGYTPNSRGEMLIGRLLVIPIAIGNKLSTIELIDGEGRKAALAGKGTKSGGYWASQCLPEKDSKDLVFFIGEGAITVLAANKVTGYPEIAALSSSNLVAVSKMMRERYPKASLVILADLIKTTGQPDSHAIDAAQAVGGLLAIPDFGLNRHSNDKDFNDMKLLFGDELTHQAIMNAKLAPGCEQNPVDSVNKDSRFVVIPAAKFASIENSSWLIKGVIPKAEIVMVFGPSGSGKSFLVLDFAFAIARGIQWCGRNKVCQDRVVYIAAEAAGGLRKRLVAYAKYHDIRLDDVPLDVIPVAPDFLGGRDVTAVSQSIGRAGLIILDTLACVAAGGDENSSTDMGKVLAHCKMLHVDRSCDYAGTSHGKRYDKRRSRMVWNSCCC